MKSPTNIRLKRKIRLLRITTAAVSLDLLLEGQMKFMSENSFDVLMVSADGNVIDRIIEKEGVAHEVINFTRNISPIKDLLCLFQLIIVILKFKPDIVHTHTPKAGIIGMLASYLTGVRLRLHTVAGSPPVTKGIKGKLFSIFENLTFKCAHFVLPNSKSLKLQVEDNYSILPDKLDIIGEGSSNGIDTLRFSKEHLIENKLISVKESIGYSTNNYYLLAIGRVVVDKGIIELVTAFMNMKLKYPNLRLLLIGPFENLRKNEILPDNIIDCISMDVSIIHINWSDEVEYYYSLADLFIHASHREGFPNVVLQAAAMECPILCSKIPGNIDIVDDGVTGLHFQVGDIQQLENQIEYAITNPNKLKVFSKNARDVVENSFNRHKVHQNVLEFYESKSNYYS